MLKDILLVSLTDKLLANKRTLLKIELKKRDRNLAFLTVSLYISIIQIK